MFQRIYCKLLFSKCHDPILFPLLDAKARKNSWNFLRKLWVNWNILKKSRNWHHLEQAHLWNFIVPLAELKNKIPYTGGPIFIVKVVTKMWKGGFVRMQPHFFMVFMKWEFKNIMKVCTVLEVKNEHTYRDIWELMYFFLDRLLRINQYFDMSTVYLEAFSNKFL